MRTHSSRPTRLKYWLFNSLPIAIACWTFGSFLLYFTYVAGVGLSSLPTEDASFGRFSAELEATRLAKQNPGELVIVPYEDGFHPAKLIESFGLLGIFLTGVGGLGCFGLGFLILVGAHE